jgi:hypothetical protein
MSTVRQSLLRLCYRLPWDGQRYPPVHVGLIESNWQALPLLLSHMAGGEHYERHVSETLAI